MQHLPVIVENIYMVFLEFVYSFGSHIIYNNGKLRNNYYFRWKLVFLFILEIFQNFWGQKTTTENFLHIRIQMDLCLKRPWCKTPYRRSDESWSRPKERPRWTQCPLVSTRTGLIPCRKVQIHKTKWRIKNQEKCFLGGFLLEKLESVMLHFYI